MSTTPYELLARFHKNGTIAGVSVRTITTVNGRDFESDPTPLSGANDPAFVAFAGQFAAGAVAERDQLRTEKAELETSLAARTKELAAMTTARNTELAAKAQAQEQVQSLTTERNDALAAKTAAEAALTAMTVERDAQRTRANGLQAELDAIRSPVNPPLIPTTVIRRMGFARFGVILEQCKTDPQLNSLVQFMLAAREIDRTVQEFAAGIQYVESADYATQAELDEWFAPVTA